MMHPRPTRRPPAPRRAFTVTELMVVIAIIAVLVGLLVPVVRRVRASARTVKCLSNQRQIMAAWNNYAVSNAGRLVSPRTDAGISAPAMKARVDGADFSLRDLGWTHWWVWAYNGGGHTGLVNVGGRLFETPASITSGVLFPYIGSMAIYVSPDEPAASDTASTGGMGVRLRSYSINCALGTTRPNENTGYDHPFVSALNGEQADISRYATTTLGSLRKPGRMLATIVENDPANYNGQGWVIHPDTPMWVDAPATWRPDAITMSYVDGSTGTYALTDPRLIAGWATKGHNYEQPIDAAAGFAIDWKYFRDRLNPGVIPDSTFGFGGQ
ncbi:MAG: type II secretion system protein [Planctomycetota bacterium]